MSSDDELEAAFKDLVHAVRGLDKIPTGQFAGRLHNKARRNDNVQTIFAFFETAPDYNPLDEGNSYSQELDGRDADDLIVRLSMASVAKGTMKVDSSKDHQNYKQFIYTVSKPLHGLLTTTDGVRKMPRRGMVRPSLY